MPDIFLQRRRGYKAVKTTGEIFFSKVACLFWAMGNWPIFVGITPFTERTTQLAIFTENMATPITRIPNETRLSSKRKDTANKNWKIEICHGCHEPTHPKRHRTKLKTPSPSLKLQQRCRLQTSDVNMWQKTVALWPGAFIGNQALFTM